MRKISVIKNVKNINNILQQLSLKSNLETSQITGLIQNYQTYISTNDKDYTPLENTKLDDNNFFDDEVNNFMQIFEISVFKKPIESSFEIINHNFESVDLLIKQNFKIPENDEQWEVFFKTINFLKAQEGILLRNECGFEKIKQKILSLDGFQNDTILKLDSAPSYRYNTQKLTFKADVKEGKKNYISVLENEKIAEFILPSNEIGSRNLKGEFIKITKDKIPPKVVDEIITKENDGKIEYYSKESGFVIFENNYLNFTKEVKILNLSLKDNYYFSGNIESKGIITISTNNEVNDALQDSTYIKANTIIINGNIGAKTRIEGKNVKITGQTHKDSTIIAQSVELNVHKGTLYCKNGKIQNCENATLYVEYIDILNLNGATINCKSINIQNVLSHSSIRFAKSCAIDNLRGGDNKFIFSAITSKDEEKYISALQKNLEQTELELINLKKQIQALSYQHNKYSQTAKELKKTIEANILQNTQTPKYIIDNYNAFLDIENQIKEAKKNFITTNKNKENITKEIKDKEAVINSAILICKSGWNKYNDVAYELILPKTYIANTFIDSPGSYNIEGGQIIYRAKL